MPVPFLRQMATKASGCFLPSHLKRPPRPRPHAPGAGHRRPVLPGRPPPRPWKSPVSPGRGRTKLAKPRRPLGARWGPSTSDPGVPPRLAAPPARERRAALRQLRKLLQSLGAFTRTSPNPAGRGARTESGSVRDPVRPRRHPQPRECPPSLRVRAGGAQGGARPLPLSAESSPARSGDEVPRPLPRGAPLQPRGRGDHLHRP